MSSLVVVDEVVTTPRGGVLHEPAYLRTLVDAGWRAEDMGVVVDAARAHWAQGFILDMHDTALLSTLVENCVGFTREQFVFCIEMLGKLRSGPTLAELFVFTLVHALARDPRARDHLRQCDSLESSEGVYLGEPAQVESFCDSLVVDYWLGRLGDILESDEWRFHFCVRMVRSESTALWPGSLLVPDGERWLGIFCDLAARLKLVPRVFTVTTSTECQHTKEELFARPELASALLVARSAQEALGNSFSGNSTLLAQYAFSFKEAMCDLAALPPLEVEVLLALLPDFEGSWSDLCLAARALS